MRFMQAAALVLVVAVGADQLVSAGKIVKKKLAAGGAVAGAAGATGFAGGFLTAAAVAGHLNRKHHGYGGGFHGPVGPVQVHNHHHVHNHLPVPHKPVHVGLHSGYDGHHGYGQQLPLLAHGGGYGASYGKGFEPGYGLGHGAFPSGGYGSGLGLIGGHGYGGGFGHYGKNLYDGGVDVVAKSAAGGAAGGYRGSPPGGW